MKSKHYHIVVTPRKDVTDTPIKYEVTGPADGRIAGYTEMVDRGLFAKIALVETTKTETTKWSYPEGRK